MSKHKPVELTFADNTLLIELAGVHNAHLDYLEHKTGVSLNLRGSIISLKGDTATVTQVQNVLNALYTRLQKGQHISQDDIDAALRFSSQSEEASTLPVSTLNDDDLVVRTRKKFITPRTTNQAHYVKALQKHDMVFGIGPAGTGKTYLAVAYAVELLLSNKVERLILSRPAVEAGENLGFLPGDLRMKVDPYLRPLYDALHDMLPPDVVAKKIEANVIEVAPLAFMRGRTLANAFVILDEAQNATAVQMKMFLTRMGEGARVVITGDLSQIDLPRQSMSGLPEALQVIQNIDDIGVIHFTEVDVVRHPLVAKIVKAYGVFDQSKKL